MLFRSEEHTSELPSSRPIKPKPFALLNHFTVPFILTFFFLLAEPISIPTPRMPVLNCVNQVAPRSQSRWRSFPWITSGQLGWPVEQRSLSLFPGDGVVKRVYRLKPPFRAGFECPGPYRELQIIVTGQRHRNSERIVELSLRAPGFGARNLLFRSTAKSRSLASLVMTIPRLRHYIVRA